MEERVISSREVHSHRHQLGCTESRLLLPMMLIFPVLLPTFLWADLSTRSHKLNSQNCGEDSSCFGNRWTWEAYFPCYVVRICSDSRGPRGHGNAIGEGQVGQLVLEAGQHWQHWQPEPPRCRIKTKQAPLSTQNKHTLTPWSILAPISAQHNGGKWQTERL